MGECFDGNTESPSQAEIGDLEVALLVDEQILGFEITVDDSAGMAIVQPVDDLEHEELDVVGSHRVLVFR